MREMKAMGQEDAEGRTGGMSRNSPLSLPAWHFQSQAAGTLAEEVFFKRNNATDMGVTKRPL